ncbi:Aldo/keto reductase [Lentinula aciculospora]|uniref:Aldo/keto reductase n=1 Tax=Lentinula aciculospora TaxID=153920 RepID=A0A9W9AJM5_9AGAR|nr:Aldo/keto reductase [Lentinula aciculospora]
MNTVPQFKLNNGEEMPAAGIGCWMGTVGDSRQVTEMVLTALRLGYRHIDTASNYGNELSVGQAIRESNVPRSEIYLVTKLSSEDHGRPEKALEYSLNRLGVDYVDLYLMHWPQAFDVDHGRYCLPEDSPTFIESWKMMENLVETGKTRSIGVSNFSIKNLDILLKHARIIPVTNQVEMHPYLPQHDLLAYCSSRGILLTAYAPVGKHKFATNPSVLEIAQRNNVSVAQVLLGWGVKRGTAVIPKSTHETRLKENLTLVSLEDEDMQILDNLHRQSGMHHSVCGFHSSELGGSCFGWTYAQLGWDMIEGGIMRS